jgi:hypothetical protein
LFFDDDEVLSKSRATTMLSDVLRLPKRSNRPFQRSGRRTIARQQISICQTIVTPEILWNFRLLFKISPWRAAQDWELSRWFSRLMMVEVSANSSVKVYIDPRANLL